MKAFVLAPIDNSPFGLAVAELCRREQGIDVVGVAVRSPWTWRRLRSEFKRDGIRLMRKAWRKLILEQSTDPSSGERSFYDVVRELAIQNYSLTQWCRTNNVPYRSVSDINSSDCVEFLRESCADIVAFTGGGLIRGPLIEAAGLGILNAHMGLLPAYRGMDVVEWPLLEGCHESVGLGVSLHFIDSGVDTGPVIATYPVPLAQGDTMERLRTRFEPIMVEAMIDGIRRARDGSLIPQRQFPEQGRQYFVMHPRLYEKARERLRRVATEWTGT